MNMFVPMYISCSLAQRVYMYLYIQMCDQHIYMQTYVQALKLQKILTPCLNKNTGSENTHISDNSF